jgi:hypothetical protein
MYWLHLYGGSAVRSYRMSWEQIMLRVCSAWYAARMQEYGVIAWEVARA